ncbi:SDR family NAD(P)-dependent oxidoreductase [Labrys wisconsinensis]|uniref:NAD(P)-dependent dehydrogenase (Short-subunit alcohol dehydrogenase family) n=1 Tax=Labrys wisconsinensis TaxID=425677 RepID=A0ABU0JCV4_9HYPH|nr:SDR family oxidoreductase [Labrys wisconsinensis]MDQ0472115.1 NAD(P)-dependent dehydrogenase (short-subunit alcohol dehydrogenase family) [Labrys wisconsinensis]
MKDMGSAAALVTGGGTGIGRATALALAEAGVRRIAISYASSQADAAGTVGGLTALGVEAFAVQADVRREGEVKAMVSALTERFGRLDILVNNAGTTRYVPIRDLDALSDEIWDVTLDTNLRGAFYCCRAAAPLLKAGGGVIVNVASIAGIRGAGSSIAYAVSKAGLIQLTRVLAVAMAPEVRVNGVAPGMVQTRWIERGGGATTTPAEAERVAASTPLARAAMPEDVADAVLGLIRSRAVTGETLVVDGGKSLTYA